MDHDETPRFSRRGVLGAGALAASAALVAPTVLRAAETAPDAARTVSPDEALQRLVEGNSRYVRDKTERPVMSADRESRAEAQFPFAGLLSCADSRVAPELAFDQGPGDLFVVRLAGNFVDTSGLASIEFGVAVLGIPLLVVLGHTGCGAISATIDVIENGTALPGHLPELVTALKPGVEQALARSPADPLAEATAQNVRYNVERLQTATPIVGEAVAAGKVKVVGGIYDIATGKVALL